MEIINQIDEWLLLALNGNHTEFMNAVMTTVTGKFIWIPFYVMLFVLMGRQIGWKKAIYGLIAIGLAIALADQICSMVIRPMVGRMRPTNPNNPISALITIVDGHRGGKYGFPSCHASNTVALSVLIINIFRKNWITWMMVVWTLMLCISRIYLGVHYPTDILVGGLIGGFIAWGIWLGAKYLGVLKAERELEEEEASLT